MHNVRLLLTVGWLVLILSLFYDPFSAYLTDPDTTFSPFHIQSKQACFQFQGQCLALSNYAMGARIFWGMVVPASVLILLVLGHEAWRRICPLSFMSQIPRALGIQRRRKVVNPVTKATRFELVTIAKDSWLGRNGLNVQFALLFISLNIRLLLVNSDRLLLGIFLITSILTSITVGYLFGGKTWCQYFCPMAPVQMVYTGTRGLLGSEAHQGVSTITQSMCRSADREGNEKSACVSCQSPCFDIDAERAYWDTITQSDRKLLYYGYVGLVIGFYIYFSLYSGNWSYLSGGVWNETDQFAALFNPGFYIANQAIPIPKILAVPLTLSVTTATTYLLGLWLERLYKHYNKKRSVPLSHEQIQHWAFSFSTFFAFNFLFFLGVYPTLGWLTPMGQSLVSWLAVIAVTIWLYRTLGRNTELYNRESITTSLRRQLNKLGIDFSKLLEGRSLENLKPDEVYVLAKTLPGLNHEKRMQMYKGVLQEALASGNVRSSSSLEVFKTMRVSLGMTDEEHQNVLLELGIADPSLLNPEHQLTREHLLRIESYRQALEMILLELVESGTPMQTALQLKQRQILALKREYNITAEEEEHILAAMFHASSTMIRAAESLVSQLQILSGRSRALNQLVSVEHKLAILLQRSIEQKQQLVLTQLLGILEILGDIPEALKLVSSLRDLAVSVLQNLLYSKGEGGDWGTRLSPQVFEKLIAIANSTQARITPPNLSATIEVLLELLHEVEPVTQAASLYALNLLEPTKAIEQARTLLSSGHHLDELVKETAKEITGKGSKAASVANTLLIKVRHAGRTEEHVFQQPSLRVGREENNDLVLQDKPVSRQHAVFFMDEIGVKVQDLGSANGLRIGNRLLRNEQVQLSQGDVVYFSNTPEPSITVRWEVLPRNNQNVSKSLDTFQKLLLLFESSFFKGLKTDVLVELARQAEVKTYRADEFLYQQGKVAQEILVVVSGSIQMLGIQGDRSSVLTTISPGETIGELEVLTHRAYRASFVAVTPAVGLTIKADLFEEVIRQDALFAQNLLVKVSDRLQTMLTSSSIA
ncbi:cyclic nucleotide-binding domain-containing protein [Tumidithrix elongata RA019]|uniref:Cyclic nucleotide-binding domain-containing protein n=2 Tax=Tumidithrix TaxID=3088355 RepID=A0AAW9Q0A0_9CYAN|nr:cyclic nucleotide-binding domain-containing protein [Tumidithrix elongata RA019]